MIYTGKDRDNKLEIISLAKDYFEKPDAPLDLVAKVIKGKEKDVVWQYIKFTDIWDESVNRYGKTRNAAEIAINRCINEGFLVDFFKIHKKEVISNMEVLFDLDYNINALKKEAAEAAAEAAAREAAREGKREGKREGAILGTIKTYKKFSQTEEQTAGTISSEFGLSLPEAKTLVRENWN